jgi:predicted DNA-binding transcriptional regulator AlpA
MSSKTWIPAPQVAEELGIHRRSLARWLLDNELGLPAAVRIKHRLYFDRAALEDWKSARLRKSIADAR